MAIPEKIKLKNSPLPASPGVYLFRDSKRRLLYIGKATSLKIRVNSHFSRPFDARIEKMTTEVRSIEFIKTPTAIEALMLESRLIKKRQPYYNILSKDDKSYVYLAFSREDFPRPVFIRGHELARTQKRQFLKILGPFKSAGSVQAALDAVRKVFPWSECRPPKDNKRKPRPCFYRHLKKCPGVCVGEISSEDYKKIIRQLIQFLEGGRVRVVSEIEKDMKKASKAKHFEEAARLRDRLSNLKQVRDLSVIKQEWPDIDRTIDVFGRIEGYDISHISGKDMVGSMVVFIDGRPKKSEYRKFKIIETEGPDDTKALAEVLRRRFKNSWPLPDLILVDGGAGQVNAVKKVLSEFNLKIPLVGLAKGPDSKQDELVYYRKDHELMRLAIAFKPLLQQLRDEAHRFAVGFHRKRRAKRLIK